jgi:hypothetical protein
MDFFSILLEYQFESGFYRPMEAKNGGDTIGRALNRAMAFESVMGVSYAPGHHKPVRNGNFYSQSLVRCCMGSRNRPQTFCSKDLWRTYRILPEV